MSRYVLSLEANRKDGWIGRHGLAEALDSYLAIYQRVLVDLVLFLGSRPKQGVNQVMGKERPSLELLCLRSLMLGLPVSILTAKVKGQFRHRDLYRDGATCVTHRRI